MKLLSRKLNEEWDNVSWFKESSDIRLSDFSQDDLCELALFLGLAGLIRVVIDSSIYLLADCLTCCEPKVLSVLSDSLMRLQLDFNLRICLFIVSIYLILSILLGNLGFNSVFIFFFYCWYFSIAIFILEFDDAEEEFYSWLTSSILLVGKLNF